MSYNKKLTVLFTQWVYRRNESLGMLGEHEKRL